MTRITLKQVPVLKQAILHKRQNFICALCPQPLTVLTGCLDHDHYTGAIRGVLCRNCNGIEGKIKNLAVRGRRGQELADYIIKVAEYWKFHAEDRTGYTYPTHTTDDEKRVKRNVKARKARAKAKKV